MHILHLVHQYLPESVGGTELYTRWLAHELSRRAHRVSVFYRRAGEDVGQDHREEGGVDVWAAWAGRLGRTRRLLATFGDPAIVRAFEHVLDHHHPDLVHIQHMMGLPASLLGSIQRRQLPFIVTLWDYWWVCANAQLLTNYSQQVCDGPRACLNCARCALARADRNGLWLAVPGIAGVLAWRNHLLQRVMRAADRLIAPTEFVRRWYVAHGAPPDRLLVIPPGLEYPSLIGRQSEKPSNLVRFAYIGGISWQKGLHVLVEAFNGVDGPAELWIAGEESFDPVYSSRLHAQASSKVRFLGKLTRQQVWDTLAQVHVVVVPSIWYETFSFLISEAFAAGLPVVASRLGPLADRVRDGIDGLLVPPGDGTAWRAALQKLVDEPDLLNRLRANVQPPMTLEEHVSQVESLCAQVIQGREANLAKPD